MKSEYIIEVSEANFQAIETLVTALDTEDAMEYKKRVLIVDDNPTNRRILSLQMNGWGMIPCETGSPKEALDWLRRAIDG